jgi:hypothetical protein
MKIVPAACRIRTRPGKTLPENGSGVSIFRDKSNYGAASKLCNNQEDPVIKPLEELCQK